MIAGFALAAAGGWLLSSSSSSATHRAPANRHVVASREPALPPPPAGFRIPKPVALRDARDTTRWAPVIRSTVARRAPDADAAAVETVSTRTPEGTANLIVATREVDRGGVLWVRASLATLPNGIQGWLPRAALGAWSFVDTRLVVDRARLTATLFDGGRVVFRAPVGVGAARTPTPPGRFYVRDRLTGYTDPTYGALAFGTSARSATLTDWPAGGFIGIHGTDQPGLIPGRISHGCIRLRNAAILRLGRLMAIGTPLIVR